MDWKQAIQAERVTLAHIIALLFALADLAELACARSQPVRSFVLWLLRPAEAAVRHLVTGTPTPVHLRQPGSTPADAMRLARDFRDLARELEFQAMDAGDSLLFRLEAAAVQTWCKRKSKLSPGVTLAPPPTADTS